MNFIRNIGTGTAGAQVGRGFKQHQFIPARYGIQGIPFIVNERLAAEDTLVGLMQQ